MYFENNELKTQQQYDILNNATILTVKFRIAAIFTIFRAIPVSCYISTPAVLHHPLHLINTTVFFDR